MEKYKKRQKIGKWTKWKIETWTHEKNRNLDSYGALKEWTKAIDIAPNNHYLFYNRGLTYSKLQLLSQAIKDFDESIKLKPDRE